MTAPTTKAADLAAVLAQYRSGLSTLSDAELEHRAAVVAALPGSFAGELRRLVDEERESRLAGRPVVPARSRALWVTAGVAVAGAPAAVLAGRAFAGYADRVPQVLLYSPAVAVGLVAAAVGAGRVARWVDDLRHPVAVDVDEADLDPYGRELLARVRARRAAGGETR